MPRGHGERKSFEAPRRVVEARVELCIEIGHYDRKVNTHTSCSESSGNYGIFPQILRAELSPGGRVHGDRRKLCRN